MKNDVSKAQREVWEWKEKAYEQIKNLPAGEQIKFIQEQTKHLVERIKRKRREKMQAK
ncbi:MAG: hypothetical protein M3342_24950 [Bacteroidota bacterium]|nr:hypothetical protein [Bacteroidota bacterium]